MKILAMVLGLVGGGLLAFWLTPLVWGMSWERIAGLMFGW